MNKFLKIVIFSLLEALTIGLLWDFLFDKGHIVLAALATFLLIAVEHVMARNAANGVGLFSGIPHRFGLQAVLGITEMIFWTIWRLIHEKVPVIGPVIAMVVFGLLMTPQHNAEHNVNNDNPFWKKLFRSQGLTISFIESVTAMAWLFADDAANRVIALVPLFLGLLVEHVVREFGEPVGANF